MYCCSYEPASRDSTVQVTTSAGSSNTVTVSIEGQPTISGISPGSGAAGTQVMISGANFGPSQDSIMFWGSSQSFQPTIVSWQDAEIVLKISSTAPVESGYFQVSALGYTVNSPTFNIVGPPTIYSASPSPVAEGASLWLNGTAFGNTQGSSTVTLNGTAAPLCSITSPNPWTNSSICVSIPANEPLGTTAIQVTTMGGAGNTISVGVEGPPTVSNLNPNIAPAGSQVTINGANFGPSQGNSYVQFQGSVQGFNPTINSWSDAQIVLTVPTTEPQQSGTFLISALGFSINSPTFTIVGPPTIYSASPSPVADGARLWLNGTAFGNAQGSSTVTLNGTTASLCSITSPNPWANSSICVSIPANQPLGSITVQVATSAGASNTISVNVEGQPTISSIAPLSAPAGSQVTINGANFGPSQGNSYVQFQGSVQGFNPTINSWSDTQIVLTVPTTEPQESGTFLISALGFSINSPTFTISSSPAIASLTPNSGLP